jgi:hypothetical protein
MPYLLGYNAVKSGRSPPTSLRNSLFPSSGLALLVVCLFLTFWLTLRPWISWQYVPPKRPWTSAQKIALSISYPLFSGDKTELTVLLPDTRQVSSNQEEPTWFLSNVMFRSMYLREAVSRCDFGWRGSEYSCVPSLGEFCSTVKRRNVSTPAVSLSICHYHICKIQS